SDFAVASPTRAAHRLLTAARSLPTRVDQYVERGGVCVGVLGAHDEALGALDEAALIRQRRDRPAVLGKPAAPGGQHFPWPDGVQLFYVGEQQDPYPSRGSRHRKSQSPLGRLEERNIGGASLRARQGVIDRKLHRDVDPIPKVYEPHEIEEG